MSEAETSLRAILKADRAEDLSRNDAVTEAVAEGFALGMEKALKNEELMKKFWDTGYKQLSSTASNNASQWVGKRVIIAIAVAILSYLLVWCAKNGAFGK